MAAAAGGGQGGVRGDGPGAAARGDGVRAGLPGGGGGGHRGGGAAAGTTVVAGRARLMPCPNHVLVRPAANIHTSRYVFSHLRDQSFVLLESTRFRVELIKFE